MFDLLLKKQLVERSIDKLNDLFSDVMGRECNPDIMKKAYEATVAENLLRDFKITKWDFDNMSCEADFAGCKLKTYTNPLGEDEYEVITEILN